MHCHSSRYLSISSSTQIFYASLLNPHHTLHTLLPRTSKKLPLLIYFTITPLPPTTITFTRTPPDLWTIIPQFLIFEIKVCKHSIKTTLRNSSTKTSRTPPPKSRQWPRFPSASCHSFPLSTPTSSSSTTGHIPQHAGLIDCQNSLPPPLLSPHSVI